MASGRYEAHRLAAAVSAGGNPGFGASRIAVPNTYRCAAGHRANISPTMIAIEVEVPVLHHLPPR